MIKFVLTLITIILCLGLLAVALLGLWVTIMGIQSLYYTFKEIYKNGKSKNKKEEKETDA